MTTKTDQCQWIGAEQQGPLYEYKCTQHNLQGKLYCAEHYPRVYAVGSAVRRKKDARRAAAVWDLESEINSVVEELANEGEI